MLSRSDREDGSGSGLDDDLVHLTTGFGRAISHVYLIEMMDQAPYRVSISSPRKARSTPSHCY